MRKFAERRASVGHPPLVLQPMHRLYGIRRSGFPEANRFCADAQAAGSDNLSMQADVGPGVGTGLPQGPDAATLRISEKDFL